MKNVLGNASVSGNADVPMATRLRRWARADVWGGNGTAGPFLEEVADALNEKDAEIKRLRSELLAAERIEYNDWTPSKGGRRG